MINMLANIDKLITTILDSLGIYGPILGSILILVESIVPALPLSVFITLNFYAFGNIIGFIISYVLTVIGCNMAFFLSRKLFQKRLDKIKQKYGKNKMLKLMNSFKNIKFNKLIILIAFPFSPAFMINILSGTSGMPYKKFLYASILGKPFMVYFWGFIGVTILDSFKHPLYLIEIVLILGVAYFIGTIINKKLDLD